MTEVLCSMYKSVAVTDSSTTSSLTLFCSAGFCLWVIENPRPRVKAARLFAMDSVGSGNPRNTQLAHVHCARNPYREVDC